MHEDTDISKTYTCDSGCGEHSAFYSCAQMAKQDVKGSLDIYDTYGIQNITL